MSDTQTKPAATGATSVDGALHRDEQKAVSLYKRHTTIVTGALVIACALIAGGVILFFKS